MGDRSGSPGTAFLGPSIANVSTPQLKTTTAMIVVAIMIFNALSLDSWIPSKFWRKKYSVTAMAISIEPPLANAVRVAGSMCWPVTSENSSHIRPITYWPAATLLIGPVST